MRIEYAKQDDFALAEEVAGLKRDLNKKQNKKNIKLRVWILLILFLAAAISAFIFRDYLGQQWETALSLFFKK